MASANPAVTVESLKERFAAAGRTFPTDLGVEPLEVTDEFTRGRLLVGERHLHPGKLVHGGVWVGFGDTIAAWQTFRHLPPGDDFTTIELKLNAFAAAGEGDELLATARHLHAGRSTHVIEVGMSLGNGKLAANLIVTQFVLPAQAGP